MKSIAKFFLAVLSFIPVTSGAAPVSTTAGSNLTGYNGTMGSMVGNQWNNATNPRANMQQTTAKANYGNCESIILRCAKPKCSGGGCADINVAQPIVAGCVNSNATCKKHGDGLIASVAGQLVATSVAEQNRQAAETAAAQSAAEQNAAAMQQQMQQMQQQMQSMQQQNSAQIASLQNALAESQQATADAVNMAAQNAAASVMSNSSSVVDAGTGLSATQTAAVRSGVDSETIQRATITGQVLTSMEGVDSSLNQLKTVMRDAFRYGKCNEINGDNCAGPKRVKKFRELANKFFEPYDSLENNLEEALAKAQSAGVDLGNIYMYFSGSCNRWAEYICRGEALVQSMDSDWNEIYTLPKYDETNCKCETTDTKTKCESNRTSMTRGGHNCTPQSIIPVEDLVGCTINKYLDPSTEDITDRVLNPSETDNATIRVGCASDIGNSLLKHRRSSGKGKSGIDIDLLQMLVNQSEGVNKFAATCPDDETEKNVTACYCGLGVNIGASLDNAITDLKASTISKALKKGTIGGCCNNLGSCGKDCYDMDIDVIGVDPVYALCDTHVYNAGFDSNDDVTSGTDRIENKDKMEEIIGLKTTVIAQQMYKQYTTLEKMIKQLKIMLEKEVLKANLQVAGGVSSGDDDSSADKIEFENCRAQADESGVLSCLRRNFAQYGTFVEKGNRKTSVVKAMNADMKTLKIYYTQPKDGSGDINDKACSDKMSSKLMKDCYDELERGINLLNKQIRNEKNSYGTGFQLGLVPTQNGG